MNFSYGFLMGSLVTLMIVVGTITGFIYFSLKEFEKKRKNEKAQ